MTTVRYNGNAMVISPNTKKIMAGLFVFVFAPIITAPPFFPNTVICVTEIATITRKKITALAL